MLETTREGPPVFVQQQRVTMARAQARTQWRLLSLAALTRMTACMIAATAPALAGGSPMPSTISPPVAPLSVRVEGRQCPDDCLGIASPVPRFTWVLGTPATPSARGTAPVAYQLLLSRPAVDPSEVVGASAESASPSWTQAWNSGRVDSNATVLVPYTGDPLAADTEFTVQVRWWSSADPQGAPSAYTPSDIGVFRTSLFTAADWHGAAWIRCATVGSCLQVRSDFSVVAPPSEVRSAVVYLASAGYGEAFVNGARVGENAVLEPGWTQWNRRLVFSCYNVTHLVHSGGNAVGLRIGNGWYGHLGHSPVVKALVSVTLANGTRVLVPTLESPHLEGAARAATPQARGVGRHAVVLASSWRGAAGPITGDDIYNGESYDARAETPGWATAGFDDSDWDGVKDPRDPVLANATLAAQPMPPIRALELRPAVSVAQPLGSGSGMFVVDFGQNTAGWTRISLPAGSCPAGTVLTLRHAEHRFPNGTLDARNLRSAKATDSYVCKGDSFNAETYEPSFTYHGFRFTAVDGLPAPKFTPAMVASAASQRVVHSDVGPVSAAQFSNSVLQRLQSNVQWGQRSNLHSVPTDCDQRDERQGWMADASVSAEEAIYNFDMATFYANWLQSMRDVQLTPTSLFGDCDKKNPIYPDCNGTIADTVPHVPHLFGARPPDPSWGFAYPLVFSYTLSYHGDTRVAASLYSGVKEYADFLSRVAAANAAGIVTYHWYGDWLEPGLVASPELVSQMTSSFNYLQTLRIVRDSAVALAKPLDAKAYGTAYATAASKFHDHYYNSTSQCYLDCSQPALVYALWLEGVVADADRARIEAKLVASIETDGHLTTGIISTKWLMELLCRMRRPDVALALATATADPSWGFQIDNNATTVWEHWNANANPSGPGMNSRNHPAFASVGAFLYRALAGIQLASEALPVPMLPFASGAAFEHIAFAPQVVDDARLSAASARVLTSRGDLTSAWQYDGGAGVLSLNVTLPSGSAAAVRFPPPFNGTSTVVVAVDGTSVWSEGAFHAGAAVGVSSGHVDDSGCVVLGIGAGAYSFSART